MRGIAAEIGMGAMSLYRYVPSRDDLIELVADHLMGEIDITGIPSGDWRADLTRYANGLRAMWLRHPWVATVHRSLPGFGPHQVLLIERVMGALDAHVSIDENLRLMAMLNSYIEGAVREEISTAEEVRRSGLSESEWMARSSRRINQLVSSGKYPIFTKIVTESHQPHLSRDDQFRNGLEHILGYIAMSLLPTPESPHPPRARGPTCPGPGVTKPSPRRSTTRLRVTKQPPRASVGRPGVTKLRRILPPPAVALCAAVPSPQPSPAGPANTAHGHAGSALTAPGHELRRRRPVRLAR
ncbi:hypothetical protein GCM10009574_047300 [Streptomyces asiaticus]|uniref:HTH tetR-type domain-containing protein n=2 Tax=Streptomyces TaxID=1883 RepID=A0ABN1S8U7_9ACTN